MVSSVQPLLDAAVKHSLVFVKSKVVDTFYRVDVQPAAVIQCSQTKTVLRIELEGDIVQSTQQSADAERLQRFPHVIACQCYKTKAKKGQLVLNPVKSDWFLCVYVIHSHAQPQQSLNPP